MLEWEALIADLLYTVSVKRCRTPRSGANVKLYCGCSVYYLWALPGHQLLLVPDCNLLPPKPNMSTSEFSVNNYPHTWQVISCNYQAQLFKDKSDLSVFNATSIILFGICWGTKRFVSNEFSIKAQFVIQIKFFLFHLLSSGVPNVVKSAKIVIKVTNWNIFLVSRMTSFCIPEITY